MIVFSCHAATARPHLTVHSPTLCFCFEYLYQVHQLSDSCLMDYTTSSKRVVFSNKALRQ